MSKQYSLESDYNLNRAEKISLGKSEEGREIYAFKVGNGGKHFLSFAGVHGDETGAISGVYKAIDEISSGKMDAYLDEISYVAVPVVNPDGLEMKRRRNSRGVDINRDFGRYGLFKIRGSLFRSKESQAVRAAVEKYDPVFVASHHNFVRLDQSFYIETGSNELTDIETKIMGKILNKVQKNSVIGPNNILFYGQSKKMGTLIEYTSASCPSIRIESSLAEITHTIADVTITEELCKNPEKSFPREGAEPSQEGAVEQVNP